MGLEYQVILDANIQGYKIQLENGAILRLGDVFFENASPVNYLMIDNIPTEISYLKSPFKNNQTIPILFGGEDYKFNNSIIYFHGDIIASTFFMLTRWEEYVVKERDSHNRFSAKSSTAFKYGFLNRPIVNEYVELLWEALSYLGINQERKKRTFQLIPTHDVDLPRLWWNFKDFVRTLGGSLLRRGDFRGAIDLIQKYITKRFLRAKDPFDTFDYLMKISERNKLTSHFFFMSGGTSSKDNYYEIDHPIIIDLIRNIQRRGHSIGFHPSYNAYNNAKQFIKEKKALESVTSHPVKIGRHHFLRFQVPTTWQIWENANMTWDSNMSYADCEGFRCGVCYPFPVFNFLEKRELKLIEKPLIVMDGSLVTYQDITPEEGYQKVNNLLQEVKKYNGEFVFLWHNSAFNTPLWLPFQKIYERILNENTNNNRS